MLRDGVEYESLNTEEISKKETAAGVTATKAPNSYLRINCNNVSKPRWQHLLLTESVVLALGLRFSVCWSFYFGTGEPYVAVFWTCRLSPLLTEVAAFFIRPGLIMSLIVLDFVD